MLMGKPTGFLEWPRVTPPKTRRGARLATFKEFELGRDGARGVAARAGRPLHGLRRAVLHQGCPLGNRSPSGTTSSWRGQLAEAWSALHDDSNNFPEFTGRLCPAPCEAACVLALNDDPVTIEHDRAGDHRARVRRGLGGGRPAAQLTGKRVAVVGSGPGRAGGAQQLGAPATT
jgi:glutamate synthase (NADPH/NADH) small chain